MDVNMTADQLVEMSLEDIIKAQVGGGARVCWGVCERERVSVCE